MPELEISLEKIAWVIVRARELEGKVEPFSSDPSLAVEQGAGNLEDRSADRTRAELRGFITSLNTEEQEQLVALMWIGRGAFSPDEWPDALETARGEKTTPASEYLLGTPHLAEHLEAGLDALDISAAEAETAVSS